MQVVIVAMILKDTYSLEGKFYSPRQYIKKLRHHFANKDPYSQSYGFFMYGCERWTIKKAEHQRTDVSNCSAGEDS